VRPVVSLTEKIYKAPALVNHDDPHPGLLKRNKDTHDKLCMRKTSRIDRCNQSNFINRLGRGPPDHNCWSIQINANT
jgi:hypothetical protein